MKTSKLLGGLIAIALVAASLLPSMNASAAIPCQEHPVIEADPMMPVPAIYIELPVSLEGSLTRGGEADREGAVEASSDDAPGVAFAAENQFRCLGYGMDVAFVGNSTPQQRVHMFARPNIDAQIEQYISVDSVRLVELGAPIELADGRFLVDFAAVVDGDQYLIGELLFADVDGTLYLDGSAITEVAELNEESVIIELSTRFTREVKIVEVADGDKVVFNNLEEEASANIVISNADEEVIFEGFAGGSTLVGGEDSNMFVFHGIEPGEYQGTVTFSEDDITYNVTLVVDGESFATPEASPAN